MGCDIHIFYEIRKNDKWVKYEEKIFKSYDNTYTSSPFDWRSYNMFAFLANVRNRIDIEPLSLPKGLPDDSEYLNSEYTDDIYSSKKETLKDYYFNDWDYHSHSFFTVKELLEFDYDKDFSNKRYDDEDSYRKILPNGFFDDLEILKSLGEPENVRIIFWFDN